MRSARAGGPSAGIAVSSADRLARAETAAALVNIGFAAGDSFLSAAVTRSSVQINSSFHKRTLAKSAIYTEVF